ALDPATGKVYWSAPTLPHHWSSPIVANGIVYLAQGPAGDRQSGTSGVLTAWALPTCTTCLSLTADLDHAITPGGSATCAVAPKGGAGTVSFAAAGWPSGAGARFDPPTVPAGQGIRLTVSVPSDVKLGSHSLVISGGGASTAASLNVVVTTALITNLAVNDKPNAGAWSIQHDLQVGAQVYGDQPTTFKIVFDRVIGTDWIRPAAAARRATGSPLVPFTVATQAEVNVAVDLRAGKPSWLDKSWEDRGTFLVSSDDVTYELFRRTYPAGTVTLGPAGGGAQYLVAVQTSTQA